MKARDVLAEQVAIHHCGPRLGPERSVIYVQDGIDLCDALLDVTPEGEGVYIAPDGTLMRVRPHYLYESLYVFVPIEEATDE